MPASSVAEYTLLLLGSGIVLVVSVAVLLPNTLPTAWGRLHRQRRELRYRLYRFRQAEKAAERARRAHTKLQSRAQHVRPKQLRAAAENAEDLQTLLRQAKEKVAIAENHVRRILLDEYPPAKQQRLLKKYLPEQGRKNTPFRF